MISVGKLRALAVLVLALAGAPASAFTDLYVFGDSLSDVGNVYSKAFTWVPHPAYWEGRFTNGPVYSELLAARLGLAPLQRSNAGGNNFAHGGAKTDGSGWGLSWVVDDLRVQVDDFVEQRTADPEALHVVLAGANDFFDGQTNPQTPADNIAADLGRLYDAGAREFLVLNLPLLGATPEYNTNAVLAQTMTDRSEGFNAALESHLVAMEAQHTDAAIYRLDVANLISQLIASPELLGFANVTEPAAPGLEATSLSYDSSQIVPNPDEYLFWDAVHPTRVAHSLLADAALGAVSSPGDFNHDGMVDSLDYDTWRESYGAVDLAIDVDGDLLVGAAEYTAWRDSLVNAAVEGYLAPAPSAGVLLWLGWIMFQMANGRRKPPGSPLGSARAIL